MKLLIQRVLNARVEVSGEITGQINKGLLVFAGFEKSDTSTMLKKLAQKLLAYRVFPDEQDRMNLNILESNGEILIVSQFTLVANTNKGLRPSFTPAADAELGKKLYKEFVQLVRDAGVTTGEGRYGADMQVHLVNDGPVTFLLESN